MGVSVSMVAQKKISDEELRLLEAYNALCESGVAQSEELRDKVRGITGKKLDYDYPIDCDDLATEGGYVELGVSPEGSVEYGDGAQILIEDLPPGTFAIRVYMA